MKYLKILGPVALAVAGLMALAPSVSATNLTSPVGTNYTGVVKAESIFNIRIHNTLLEDECLSKFEWQPESHGSAVTLQGAVTSFSVFECVEKESKSTISLLKRGSFEVHTFGAEKPNSGKVTWTGARMTSVTDTAIMNIACVYELEVPFTALLTGSGDLLGKTAKVDMEVLWKYVEGNVLLCPKKTTWTAEYTITTPDFLNVD